jgi:hypothetical protein
MNLWNSQCIIQKLRLVLKMLNFINTKLVNLEEGKLPMLERQISSVISDLESFKENFNK